MVRVQRLDQNSDIETDWILLASPMAGDKAGFCFSPEPDDVAVIAFCGEQPIILGFIYPGGVETPVTDPKERAIQSRDGNALILIDGDKSGITLRDKHKNEITMNADGITIKTTRTSPSKPRAPRRSRVQRGAEPMNIQLPDPKSYSGVVLSGWTVNQTAARKR